MMRSRCKLVGTDLDGVVVGRQTYLGELDRYAVRYIDASGSPQERWFQSTEIDFDVSQAKANVVNLRGESNEYARA